MSEAKDLMVDFFNLKILQFVQNRKNNRAILETRVSSYLWFSYPACSAPLRDSKYLGQCICA